MSAAVLQCLSYSSFSSSARCQQRGRRPWRAECVQAPRQQRTAVRSCAAASKAGMSSAGEGRAGGVHRGQHVSSRHVPRPLVTANSRMSHLQATHPRQAALRAAPPHPAQWGKQQAARVVWSLVSRCASRCASREVARGVEGPGRVQWVASLRPASPGSVGRASARQPGRPASRARPLSLDDLLALESRKRRSKRLWGGGWKPPGRDA